MPIDLTEAGILKRLEVFQTPGDGTHVVETHWRGYVGSEPVDWQSSYTLAAGQEVLASMDDIKAQADVDLGTAGYAEPA